MADCDLLGGCLFFNDKMSIEGAIGKMYKTNFCQGDNSNCARHLIAQKLGGAKVPTNLYPNMIDKANAILAEG